MGKIPPRIPGMEKSLEDRILKPQRVRIEP